MTWVWWMPFSLVVSCVPISHYSYLILGESNGLYHSLCFIVLNFCWNFTLHSKTYNVQDFMMDITQIMVLWVFTPCNVMHLFWCFEGISCHCGQGNSLIGVDVSVTLKKEAAHSSKMLEQAHYSKSESQGSRTVRAIQHRCTVHWVALLSLILHEFVHPLCCLYWLYWI
jgi:hypothetical protein